ncbi:MAG: prepilin-type N-terminal cleavage/methylation domain-containing protein [Clostridia bacterium]|nr:prepilin-type N-terminal cleavage/methylation domain-containing protein [Clostridia bacterium]
MNRQFHTPPGLKRNIGTMKRMLKHSKIVSNNRGVTLVELLVAIGILGLVAVPFLSTILSSTRNNTYSYDMLSSSVASQKVMEEIKANPPFLKSEAAYFSTAPISQYKVYPYAVSDPSIRIKYRVEKLSEGILPGRLPGDEKKYSSFLNKNGAGQYVDIPFGMLFEIEQGKIKFNGSLYEPSPRKYFLDIQGTAGVYSYSLKDDSGTQLSSESINGVTESQINIKIKFNDLLPGVFELYANVDEQIDKEVYFYVINRGEPSRLKLVNNLGKQFYEYDNLIGDPVKEYFNSLYRIKVVVEKNNEDVNTMISYVKK